MTIGPHIPERRRSPRAAVQHGPRLRVSQSVRVRLLDISADGALLGAEEMLPVRTVGRLRVRLGAQVMEAHVQVRRATAGSSTLYGVTLVPAEPQDREALDQFLRRAGG